MSPAQRLRARVRRVVAGSLLAAAVCAPAPTLAQVPGAEYSGTINGGGTVKLSVGSNGTEIQSFRAFDVPGQDGSGACGISLAGLYALSVPIVGNAFSRPDPTGGFTFDGVFPSPQQAQGTLNITYQGCVTGTRSWTAGTTATAPTPSPTPGPTPSPTPAPSGGSVSGSIGNVHVISGGRVSATYTTTFSLCTASGYCGWYAHAWQLPASQPCSEDTSHLTYVGDLHSTSGTETETDTFSPAFSGRIRLCLYARQASVEHLVAEAVFAPGGPTSSRPFSMTRAQSEVRRALTRRFGTRFTRGLGYRRACSRRSALRVRCVVSWRYARDRYRGSVTVWVHSITSTHTHYSIRIVRTRGA
ncbi:hypothetical protein FSW04_04495 [Baekduia soli]|uniref:Uncharacterized protein n=1 Tax=Baekduia soli TaxID=496014 RepID=A0A5B8U1U3_9ACTN|nr:hypothetical protein [Baekduia soli]QEC46920.1 hypothetical protein FSW04_04495 [Baekduia soli]